MSDARLVWPDGTVYTITRSSRLTAGATLEMEWQLPAGGWAPQPHVHPDLTEEYEVLEGALDLRVGRAWRTLRPVEPYIRSLCRTANERDLGALRGPRSLLYIAMLVDEYPDHSRAAGRVLNLAAGPIAAMARRFGLSPAGVLSR